MLSIQILQEAECFSWKLAISRRGYYRLLRVINTANRNKKINVKVNATHCHFDATILHTSNNAQDCYFTSKIGHYTYLLNKTIHIYSPPISIFWRTWIHCKFRCPWDKRKTRLDTTPKTKFSEMVAEMARTVMEEARRDALCQQEGYKTFNYHE